jgi:hypothetical protein
MGRKSSIIIAALAAFGQGDADATHLRRTGDRSGDRRGWTRVGTILDVCLVWPGRGVWV